MILTPSFGEKCEKFWSQIKSVLSRVANKRRVWKKNLNLINEGSGTNGGPGIFVTLYKEAFEISHEWSLITIGPGIFSQKE